MNMTPEMQAVISAAVQAALAANGSKPKKARKARKQAVSRNAIPREERQKVFAEAVVEAFEKAGFGKVTPNDDVLSYNRWLEAGFKVRPGEKSVRVKDKLHRRGQGLPLFHRSQVEPISA